MVELGLASQSDPSFSLYLQQTSQSYLLEQRAQAAKNALQINALPINGAREHRGGDQLPNSPFDYRELHQPRNHNR
jgi:hypothetical protein